MDSTEIFKKKNMKKETDEKFWLLNINHSQETEHKISSVCTPPRRIKKNLKSPIDKLCYNMCSNLQSKIVPKKISKQHFFHKWILKVFQFESFETLETLEKIFDKECDFRNVEKTYLSKCINDYKYKISKNNGFTLLSYAVVNHLGYLVLVLLNNGYLMDMRDKLGCTPLHWAYFSEHKEAIRLLEFYGANKKLSNVNNYKTFEFTKERIKRNQKRKFKVGNDENNGKNRKNKNNKNNIRKE